MRRILFGSIVCLALVGLASPASAQSFGWTISNSSTSPYSNSGSIDEGPTPDTGRLYLWYSCTTHIAGLAAAEFDVAEKNGGPVPTSFAPLNGFLNGGSATNLQLVAAQCLMTDTVLAGVFTLPADTSIPEIELCIVPSAQNNRDVSVSCDSAIYENDNIGFAKPGQPCSSIPSSTLCPTYTVDDETWGQVKSMYRND